MIISIHHRVLALTEVSLVSHPSSGWAFSPNPMAYTVLAMMSLASKYPFNGDVGL